MLQLDLTGTDSLAELQQRLRAYAAANPGDGWIIGRGWNQELWPDKSFPTAADLDAVVADRPVVLERVDGHAVVANSAALQGAPASPPRRRTRPAARSSATPTASRPACSSTMRSALVEQGIPAPTPAQRDQALGQGAGQCCSATA